jgi:hypothetical protein
MAKPELLNGLNEQLNREITTFLRYMLQAASIRGCSAYWANSAPNQFNHMTQRATMPC